MKKLLSGILVLPFLMGTQCIPGEIEVPYEQETPELTIDLASQVKAFEDGINNGSDTHNQAVLAALCATEASRNCSPPSLPASIPRQIPDPENTSQNIDVATWLEGVPGFDKLKNVNEAVVFSLGEEIGVEKPDQVKKVTIDAVTVQFSSNTLTYAVPPTDVYSGSGVSQADTEDADALLTDSRMSKFGTLAEIPAGDTQAHPMDLDASGKEAFAQSLGQLDVALLVHTAVAFPPSGSAPIPKPDGVGKVKAKIKAVFTISTDFGIF
ncbi:MAG: hypothetical protein JXR83_16230 [Deltaproteobacteria bacterium]|nr:hypothetical protein [Deltaproteobacteria bacterium]